MSAPLIHAVGEYLRNPKARRIDFEYNIQCIAEQSECTEEFTRQLRDIERAHLAVSIHHAVSQDSQLAQINADLGQIACAVNDLGSLIGASEEKISYALNGISDLLQDEFSDVSDKIVRLHEITQKIDQKIAQQYETRALELRRKGKEMMLHGMQSDQRDRNANLRDALNLYRACVKNPIGNLDMTAQFDLGWLEWKVNRDYEKAKRHFKLAWRIIRNNDLPNKLLIRTVRHYAHMCYRLKDYSGAFEALQELIHFKDTEILFDRARYLWKMNDDPIELDTCCYDHNGHSESYIGKPKYKESAKMILTELLQRDPTFIGRILSEQNFKNRRIRHFIQQLRINEYFDHNDKP